MVLRPAMMKTSTSILGVATSDVVLQSMRESSVR